MCNFNGILKKQPMDFLRSSWFPVLLGLIILVVVGSKIFSKQPKQISASHSTFNIVTEEWQAPDTNAIPSTEEGDLIRYGRELIANTSKYLGPKGIVAQISNGMNCQNCHIDGGSKHFANPFSAVLSTYPKFRNRSGKIESIEFRINECMERSLNGKKLDSLSNEMIAMKKYFEWLGKGVPKNIRPRGTGIEELPFMTRAADVKRGKIIYESKCLRCHGENGQGVLNPDSSHYLYPPLWGDSSYNISAGMYRLIQLAGFIKNTMPFDSAQLGFKLTNEDAWDVAAFINSQPRPQKFFRYDWPSIAGKPVDYPYGPYVDSFSETQHKYGPFDPIKNAKK
jgi:thiosulfate dehydrogenase